VIRHLSWAAAATLLVGGLWAANASGVFAQDDTIPTRFTVDGPILFMTGEINTPTLGKFEAVIADNPQITTLVQCEMPGSSDDDTMIALSYRVRDLGLNTHLTANSMVASGGTDLFLAGAERTIAAGARVGVHSWSDGTNDASAFPKDSSEHDANADYIFDMLGDEAFYWFTIYAAAADDIHWMTTAEIAQYGLATGPAKTSHRCP
jgi:hypothetical protein